jgi:hypothetical protein
MMKKLSIVAFRFGPVAGFDENGNILELIGNAWMYEAAKS